MKLLFAIIIVTSLYWSDLQAQQNYLNARVDGIGYWDNGLNIIPVTNDSIILLGNVFGSNIGISGIGIICINGNGAEHWQKIYLDDDTAFFPGLPGSLIQLSDNNYALFGSLVDTNEDYGYFIKFNSGFDTLYTRKLGTSNFQSGSQCKETKDGGFILNGASHQADIDGDFWLIKLDNQGILEWQETYGGTNYENSTSVIATTDGYVVAGATNSFGPNSANAHNAHIIKVDLLGDKKWDTTIGDVNTDCVWGIEETADSSIIIAGCYMDYEPFPNDGSSIPFITKLDKNGDLVWREGYGESISNTTLFSVHELSDGSIIGVGQTWDNDENRMAGLVLKTDHQGKLIWMRKLHQADSSENNDMLREISPTQDGSFFAVGTIERRGNDLGTQDMWVIKLDSIGCPYPNCDTTIGINERPETKQVIKALPNPNNGVFEVDLPSHLVNEEYTLNVFNLMGKTINIDWRLKESTVIVNLGDNISGLYILSLKSNSSIYTAKIIKE